MVFPAQIDTVTPELFAAGRKHADESGRRFSTHIGQSVVEVREMIRRHNMTPVQWAAAERPAEERHRAGALHPARRPSADPLAHAEGSRPDRRVRRLGGALPATLRALWPGDGPCRPLSRARRQCRARHRLRAAQPDRGDAAGDRRRPADERGHPQPRHRRRLRGGDLRRRGGARPRRHRRAGARHGGRHRAGRHSTIR